MSTLGQRMEYHGENRTISAFEFACGRLGVDPEQHEEAKSVVRERFDELPEIIQRTLAEEAIV